MARVMKKVRRNANTKAAITKAPKRSGASGKVKAKAKVLKAATGNIRSNPLYKKGFEAGLKAGMKRGNVEKTTDANI